MKLSGELLSESTLREMMGWFVHVIEAAGALIISVGAVWAFARFTTTGIRRRSLLGEWGASSGLFASSAGQGRTPRPPRERPRRGLSERQHALVAQWLRARLGAVSEWRRVGEGRSVGGSIACSSR
ncbi:hypothetical protein KPP03845_100184 [Streptomyces xanthophaeus]|uniref:hypothetical protein n=1 Tax=Streptomyces xanthophaeus TaxID=67385 RepID=UPI00233F0950|nr:hypothetical protein [Streptomyces xanthophaeus]WCD83865.1 hypothetical protein KPP03845_100184 [Streptomyces xanthophaeus]